MNRVMVMGASTRNLSWQWMIEGKAIAGTEAVNVGSSAGIPDGAQRPAHKGT